MVRTNYYFEIRVNAITGRFINKLKKREREREAQKEAISTK